MSGSFTADGPGASARRGDTVVGVDVAPLATDLRAGTVVGGYRLEELVGRGGMGVVYRARDELLERTVALKLLSPEVAADEAFRTRFVRESRMAAALEHPHIVPVYDAGEDAGLLYIAMRFVDGTDLGTMLRRHGAPSFEKTLSIAGQIASALGAAHERSIVHRDVKPANVLLDRHGAYLTDFGLTKHVAAQTRLTVQGHFVGTVDYMAPEQIQGGRLDPRSDVYAFACVLYQMLTGMPPFVHESAVSVMNSQLHELPPRPSTRRPGLPEALDAVFERALAKEKEERPATCLEVVAATRAALAQDGQFLPVTGALADASPLVLVAVSDPRGRAAIRGLLGGGRFAFAEAESEEQAVRAVREARPDAVLLEWELSDAPSDLCRDLRDAAGAGGVRLLALLSRSAPPAAQGEAADVADGVVVWPASALRLQLELSGVLANDDAVGYDL